MRSASPSRVLIVAHQTADSPELIDAVACRAKAGPCTFTLLVPRRPHALRMVGDPQDRTTREAETRLSVAVPLLRRAAGRPVAGMIGSHEPLATIQDALDLLGFDEVIISMPRVRLSGWLDVDLPSEIRALGLPVTEVLSAAHNPTGVPAA